MSLFIAHCSRFLESLSSPSNADDRTPAEILAEIAALPIEGDRDRFSGEEHDRVLYREEKNL